MINKEVQHIFSDGMKSGMDNHVKNKKAFSFGLNGRVYSKDGNLAFTSIEGTEEVYNNPKIAKYLGSVVFKDQIIVFAKCTGVNVNVGGVIFETEEINITIAKNASIELTAGLFNFTSEITDNSLVQTYSQNIVSPAPVTEAEIEDNYSPDGATVQQIDFSEYYDTNVNVPNFGVCEVSELTIPPNNSQYADCIISIQYDNNGNLFDKIIWSGYQNWPFEGKIVALGVEENNNFKRVKYTDYLNPFRSINVLDPNLFKRSPKELSNFQSTILLEPKILSIGTNGQLKSMSVQYTYRLITDNGQVTDFSPLSKIQFIYPDETIITGGQSEEVTNRSVKIKCNIVDSSNFNEIECLAIEFEASGIPTALKSLGIKSVQSVVEFDHFGNESEFNSELTFSDIISTSNQWKYCSDFSTKNNRLYASALRNDPISSQFNQLRNNFALHGWDQDGNTHESLINPDPTVFRYIYPNETNKSFFVSKRIYRSIKSFGNVDVSLINKTTSESIILSLTGSQNIYKEHLTDIKDWLLDQQINNTDFANFFQNLQVEFLDNVILFKPIDDQIQTDFSNYIFEYNNEQVIEESEDETQFDTTQIVSSQKCFGAQSAGFNTGNGIRLSYQIEEDIVLQKSTKRFDATDPVIGIQEPSLKKSFMKGEIYRLGINFYRDGERLFVIPLGDIQIPKIGDLHSYIDDSGNLVITSTEIKNQSVSGNDLKANRIELKIEFRLNCDFSKDIDMYQLVYVERTEENRTILCQGVSAPLMRLQNPVQFLNPSQYILDERLRSKWTLPFFGGPTYDQQGFDMYDQNGGEYEEDTYDYLKRTIHNRSLMYFDAPDVIYNQISDSLIKSSKVNILGQLFTDHTPEVIMEHGDSQLSNNGLDLPANYGEETFPKFSRKIKGKYLNTFEGVEDWPILLNDENTDDSTIGSHFVNVSVFPEFNVLRSEHSIQGNVSLSRGQVIPGTELGTSFEISNNAVCTPCMHWWYSAAVRGMDQASDQHRYDALPASNISFGERTIYLKTVTDVFSTDFVGNSRFPSPNSQIRLGSSGSFTIYDTHALVNIKRSNEDSVYGGRSEQAYSQNVYVPISETKPINKNDNSSSFFQIEGDTYVSLYVRTKNSFGDNQVGQVGRDFNNGRTSGSGERGDLQPSYKLNGAWAYAVVIESSIETKLNPEYEFYREQDNIDFSFIKQEILNSAYEQKNTLRNYIPRPFRFQDDPILTNIVAASETKLNGEYYDAWSSFPINEFQELDKNKGAVLNLVKEKDQIFAIQEQQTSLLHIDRDVLIPSQGAGAINVKQGAGNSIDGYTVISKYGTSIRRSIVESNDFGFTFIDERLKALIKIDRNLTIENDYHHDFYDRYTNDPIVNCEPFFDEKHKESGILITTESGVKEAIVYNEVLKIINGFYQYNTDLFINFNDEIFIPKRIDTTVNEVDISLSDELHQLNKTDYLNILGEEKLMKIGFVSWLSPNIVNIFKHIAIVTDLKINIQKISILTKEGHSREILGTHPRYKIREGIHSTPLLNYWNEVINDSEKKDLRSEWAYFEIEIPYNQGLRQSIFSVVNYVRQSYQ